MIKLEKTDVYGWEASIRGMRNPLNSWDRSDSYNCKDDDCAFCPYSRDCKAIEPVDFFIGENDHDLMMRLAKGGSTHAKYKRMIIVTVDITGPLYWLKEADTYKVGTVANSCSTMHKIHAKEFELSDFSMEHLDDLEVCSTYNNPTYFTSMDILKSTIDVLNYHRARYLETKDKHYWWQMIQLLPSTYNQKRTFLFNYEVLTAMYHDRKNHKLDEWHTFCDWVRSLPYSELITGETKEE